MQDAYKKHFMLIIGYTVKIRFANCTLVSHSGFYKVKSSNWLARSVHISF